MNQTLNPGCRGSSHFSPLDAVLDPVYRPGIAPVTLKDSSSPSPLASDTLEGSPRSSPLAPALKTSPAPDANLLFCSDSFELIQLFPIPNQTVERLQSFSTRIIIIRDISVSEVQARPTPRRSEVVVVEAGQGQVLLQEEDESFGGALE